jgi:NitT/TauT family transport system substrate-binding protein
LKNLVSSASHLLLRRRTLLAALATVPVAARAQADPALRLGILPFGSVQWIADVITHHGLDAAQGFSLRTVKLATTEAAKVALMGAAVDVAVSDWPFVAAQRAHGGHLTFAPFSASLGGIMVPAGASLRTLADLKGKRLGVAGGAQDKSWLVVRAAARASGLDLMQDCTLSFGAPPLLNASLQHGDLDALLTFWNFAARLQAAGYRQLVAVDECARLLGLDKAPVLLGYVFDDEWAKMHLAPLEGFLRAASAAGELLATRPDEWTRIRPLMDAGSDAVFDALRQRFLAGQSHPDPATMERQAMKLTAVLAEGAPASRTPTLPAGVFWHGA